MAIQWGTWQIASGSTNGMRLGVDVTYSAVTSSSSNCVVTFKVYSENKFAYNDTQTLTYGGTAGITGTLNFSNTSTTGQQVLRDTKTWTYTYPSNGAGTSKTFTATLSGAFNNVTPTVTVTASPPARPAAGVGPTMGPVTVRWVEGTPTPVLIVEWPPVTGVQNIEVSAHTYSMPGQWDAWSTPGTIGGDRVSTQGEYLTTNVLRQYQCRTKSGTLLGPWAVSNILFTKPATPGNVQAVRQPNGSVVLTWTVTHPSTNQAQEWTRYTQRIEVSTDGSTWTEVEPDFIPSSSGTQTFTDHNPPSLAATYRVTTWTPNGPDSDPGVAAEIPALPGKIFAGSERALTIYAGSSRAHKIYMGSTQVWP